MSEEKIELPPIPELTAEHAHQLVCADYLETMARLIRRGAITGFDFAWNSTMEKPLGKYVGNCGMLVTPMETRIQQAIAEFRSKQISVVDVSEQLKDHEPCDPEAADDCPICNTKMS